MVAKRPAILALTISAILGSGQRVWGQAKTPSWTRVTEHAGWQARDSSGEVVFQGKMWLLGGWFSSRLPCPRDVWSSADGVHWDLVTAEAPWTHGDLPTTMVHNDRIWIMGGWAGGRLPGASASNQVWSSTDGANWHCTAAQAPWCPRLGAAGVVFAGKMWLLGGTERYYDGDKLLNDVWSSADGAEWTRLTDHAPWSPRAFHGAVVHADKIWVIGGGNYVPTYQACNDVWCSSDGRQWTRVTESAGWSPRIWFSSLAYRDRMWVLGGWSNKPSRNWNDAWYSTDGRNWKQINAPTAWSPRHEQSAFVFHDKMWVAGGNPWPVTNDVWYIEDVP